LREFMVKVSPATAAGELWRSAHRTQRTLLSKRKHMSTRTVVVGMLVYGILVASPWGASAQPTKDEQRIQQLEKRIADLEKAVKQLEAQVKLSLNKPTLDTKVVGSWAVVMKPKEEGWKAVRLEPDGSCRIVEVDLVRTGKYDLTGKSIRFFSLKVDSQTSADLMMEVESVTAKEMTLRRAGSKQGEVIRLERQ